MKNISNETIVCVVGLGYVGLPLAKAFAKSLKVVGFDINKDKIKGLKVKKCEQNWTDFIRNHIVDCPSTGTTIC